MGLGGNQWGCEAWCENQASGGWGLMPLTGGFARQLGKLKRETCLKSHSQGGGGRGSGECG